MCIRDSICIDGYSECQVAGRVLATQALVLSEQQQGTNLSLAQCTVHTAPHILAISIQQIVFIAMKV